MGAPSEARNKQSVQIRSMQRLTTGIEPTTTQPMVTNAVKLVEGTYQAATQVKVLSPEIFNVIEADVFHDTESSTKDDAMVSHHSLYRGQSPWHDKRWRLRELGRSSVFPRGYVGTSQQRRGLTKDAEEVGLTDSTLSLGKPSTWGSGQRCRGWLRSRQASTQRLVK